ncbi:hypothetical protein T492DRAFT_850070 [Pavlovales sp. CCMP2436]|nr:hypothetical protein T492DRAFT_850070 [Pavlovales sp. CCMP2436]
MDVYQRLLAFVPNDVQATLLLGWTRVLLGERAVGTKDLRAAASLDGSSGLPSLLRAVDLTMHLADGTIGPLAAATAVPTGGDAAKVAERAVAAAKLETELREIVTQLQRAAARLDEGGSGGGPAVEVSGGGGKRKPSLRERAPSGSARAGPGGEGEPASRRWEAQGGPRRGLGGVGEGGEHNAGATRAYGEYTVGVIVGEDGTLDLATARHTVAVATLGKRNGLLAIFESCSCK